MSYANSEMMNMMSPRNPEMQPDQVHEEMQDETF